MKTAVASLLMCCLMAQCLAKLCVVGYYRINQSYIAANLCENRANKDSTCAGKCYLRKQMKKVDDSDLPAKHSTSKKEVEESPLFFARTVFSTSAHPTVVSEIRQTPARQHLHDTRTKQDIFHPPAFMV